MGTRRYGIIRSSCCSFRTFQDNEHLSLTPFSWELLKLSHACYFEALTSYAPLKVQTGSHSGHLQH